MTSPELTALALAALLQVAQFGAYSIAAQKQVGSKYAASPRDEPRQLTGTAGRLQRALNNHFEGLILFTIAVVVVVLGEATSPLTAICGWVYLAARIAYVPAYVAGLAPGRSLIWAVGFLATLVMLIAGLVA
ncbi:MAPEG family protein [Marinibacterium profundimaris]|uniref:Membrane protein n=1 Tax=Marinibacterium profundimaris TaxID=1679460 RepID=A0A225NMD2_9RHOB|nr:MAPEG family protein [Marinibacterium profundimaris]OWU73349.1 membrane protein [Marinibacterium profundimaris]